MSTSSEASASKKQRSARGRRQRHHALGRYAAASMAMEAAARAGLLDASITEEVSFRAPKALIDAAKRESGVTEASEFGPIALAMLVQKDPVAAFLIENKGVLGPDHELDY